jgi:cyclohexyl-isocyanide hydratase
MRDIHGLVLAPDTTMDSAPPLDVLLVPGGPGQEELIWDEPLLEFLRLQAPPRTGTPFTCCPISGQLQ